MPNPPFAIGVCLCATLAVCAWVAKAEASIGDFSADASNADDVLLLQLEHSISVSSEPVEQMVVAGSSEVARDNRTLLASAESDAVLQDTTQRRANGLEHEHTANRTQPPRHHSEKLILSVAETRWVEVFFLSSANGVDQPWVFMLLFYMLYTLVCVWYEIKENRKTSEAADETSSLERASAPSRSRGLDFAKAYLVFCVVNSHQYNALLLSLPPFMNVAIYTAGEAGQAFAMSTFAFVSGLVGASVAMKSLARIFATAVVSGVVLMLLWWGTIPSGVLSPHPILGGSYEAWYLYSLLFWRFTITPLFHFAQTSGCPSGVVFVVVGCLSYLVFVGQYTISLSPLPFDTSRTSAFATFYAAGLLFTPSLLVSRMRGLVPVALAVCFFTALYGGLMLSGFPDWAEAACLKYSHCGSNFWYPLSMKHMRGFGVSYGSASVFVRAFILKLSIGLAVLCVVFNGADLLQRWLPALSATIADCGSRSLHAYLLHYWWISFLHTRGGLNHWTDAFTQLLGEPALAGIHLYNLLPWIMIISSVQCTFVCSCKLTGTFTDWAFAPNWVLDLPIIKEFLAEAPVKADPSTTLSFGFTHHQGVLGGSPSQGRSEHDS